MKIMLLTSAILLSALLTLNTLCAADSARTEGFGSVSIQTFPMGFLPWDLAFDAPTFGPMTSSGAESQKFARAMELFWLPIQSDTNRDASPLMALAFGSEMRLET
jgi:hypothetical protein